MGVKLSIYNLDDISDSILLDILHKSVLDLQELCASHQAIRRRGRERGTIPVLIKNTLVDNWVVIVRFRLALMN